LDPRDRNLLIGCDLKTAGAGARRKSFRSVPDKLAHAFDIEMVINTGYFSLMRITNLNDCVLNGPDTGEKFCVVVGRHERHGSHKHHTIAVVEILAGISSEEHFHKEREESYLVLSGTGRARIDGVCADIKPGDLISAGPSQTHQFTNHGSEPLRYIVITAPSWSPSDSWK
jgi:mannose-6-phosphate isomerase-like protein (cupin superfamily)